MQLKLPQIDNFGRSLRGCKWEPDKRKGKAREYPKDSEPESSLHAVYTVQQALSQQNTIPTLILQL